MCVRHVFKHVSPRTAREFDIAISNVSRNTGKERKNMVGNGSDPNRWRGLHHATSIKTEDRALKNKARRKAGFPSPNTLNTERR